MDGSFHHVIERGMFSHVPTFNRIFPDAFDYSPLAWSKLDWFTGGGGGDKKVKKKMPRAVYPTSSPVSLILLSNEKLSSAFRAAWKKREGRRELIFTRLVI